MLFEKSSINMDDFFNKQLKSIHSELETIDMESSEISIEVAACIIDFLEYISIDGSSK